MDQPGISRRDMLKFAGAAVVLTPVVAPALSVAHASSSAVAPRTGSLRLAVAYRTSAGGNGVRRVTVPASTCTAPTKRKAWACGACAGCVEATVKHQARSATG